MTADQVLPIPLHARPASERVSPEAVVAAAMLLDALGIDWHADGLMETPARFAAALAEITSGLRGPDPAHWLARTFPPGGPHPSMITVAGLDFSSICEHHLLPFYGTAAVAYLPSPGARIVGVSKLSRMVTAHAARPQIQERLGQQVVDTITGNLDTQGAACLISATHTCMTLRGAKAGLSARMVTNHLTGRFLNEQAVRTEFLSLARALRPAALRDDAGRRRIARQPAVPRLRALRRPALQRGPVAGPVLRRMPGRRLLYPPAGRQRDRPWRAAAPGPVAWTPMTRLAYCPPGRELEVAISFALAGLAADRIMPTTMLSGDRVVLVDDGQWNGAVAIIPEGEPGP